MKEDMTQIEVFEARLPAFSLLHGFKKDGDFLDCYRVSSDLPPRTAAEVITRFPGWAKFLLVIRQIVTAPFGLTNRPPPNVDKVGIFPVETETVRELIAGFDDKHLNFRVSVISDKGAVFMATWVHPHNFAGRAYLKVVMPFHVLICRNALKRVARYRGGMVRA